MRNARLLILLPLSLSLAGCPVDGLLSLSDGECDEALQLDGKGGLIFPAGASAISAPVDVDEDRGALSDLYNDLDTTTDEFYTKLPCEPSIGGVAPADELEPQDESDADAYVASYEASKGAAIAAALLAAPPPAVAELAAWSDRGCYVRSPGLDLPTPEPCDSPLFLHSSQPFEGRDIIYVHGLATDHLRDRAQNPAAAGAPAHPAHKLWPEDATAFTTVGGYFRTYAENYWHDHIVEHLSMGWQWTAADAAPVYTPKHNRYLLIAWSSNQTIEFAQHALLVQIQDAVTNDANVVTPAGYPSNQLRPFCANGCVILSHSTGSPIVSTAMSLAAAGHFGPGGKQIPGRIVLHASLAGAIAGSRLASVVMAITQGGGPGSAPPGPVVSTLLCPILDALLGAADACSIDTAFVATSIMRDLMPDVAQGVWGPILAASPVPTVTSAGGHPTGSYGATGSFLPGLDDGVVSMNSACGNPNPVDPGVTPPSGLTVSSRGKAFDFSENAGRLLRATKIFFGQRNLKVSAADDYLAATCTPHLSPTGMVMPVANLWSGTSRDARARFPNHYSFVQSLGEHAYDGAGAAGNPWPSAGGNPASTLRQYSYFGTSNIEESNAVIDSSIYTRTIDGNGTRLAKPVGAREVVRGRKVGFKLFGKWRTRWIWKRTYHLLDKWQEKQSSHYVYEFVGRR